jgi:hypothetical protein
MTLRTTAFASHGLVLVVRTETDEKRLNDQRDVFKAMLALFNTSGSSSTTTVGRSVIDSISNLDSCSGGRPARYSASGPAKEYRVIPEGIQGFVSLLTRNHKICS